MKNPVSLDTLCAALCYAMGVEAPEQAAAPNEALVQYLDAALNRQKADRVLMYNPDAVAEWIGQKYAPLMDVVTQKTDVAIPMATVMPSVTPVCFGTMYTGAQPAVHGIQSYTKPVIRIDTIFDALLRAGKRPAIVATEGVSMSKIYLDREMDYFILDTVDAANAKAVELILADKHDFIAVYNGNYDGYMHKHGPESTEALAELRANARTFAMLDDLVKSRWAQHNTLIGFAMDHGCHEIDEGCGSHGLDMDEDINIVHYYKVHKKSL